MMEHEEAVTREKLKYALNLIKFTFPSNNNWKLIFVREVWIFL